MGRNAEPITLNKYVYGNADPVRYYDPSGKFGVLSVSSATRISGVLALATVSSYQIGQSLVQDGIHEDGYTLIQAGWVILAGRSPAASKFSELIGKRVKERNDSKVNYYRAVDTAEMISILDCNCFSFPDYGYGIEPTSVKRFWLGASSAEIFGHKFILGNYVGARENSFFVVKATISQSADKVIASSRGGTEPGDAFIGSGRAVGFGLLPMLNFEANLNGGIKMIGEYQ